MAAPMAAAPMAAAMGQQGGMGQPGQQWGQDANSMVNANGQFDMNAMMMMGMV